MKDEFRDRINHILNGRKLFAWGKALGLSSGAISRISSGHVPKAETLALIRKTENVNLNWLLTGQGRPFNVLTFLSGEEFLDYLTTALGDEDWYIHLTEINSVATIVLSQAGQYLHKDEWISYTITEIVTGPNSKELCQWLDKWADLTEVLELRTDREAARKIREGELGTYALFGDDKNEGLLESAELTCGYEESCTAPHLEQEYLSPFLLREVFELVEESLIERDITFTPNQKARVIAAVYNQAFQAGTQPEDLSEESVNMVIDAVR